MITGLGAGRIGPALTIIIATRGRRESLLETLRALDPASFPSEARQQIEIVVVDNAPTAELDHAELEAIGAGRVRLLHEPKPGKWRCLNAAIDSGLGDGLGELIAVLDDDMTPMPGWAHRVIESARANPQADLFAGKSHVVWPPGAVVPGWAGHFLAQGICFSVLTWDGGDRAMGGIFAHPSGNHFWFRRSVLDTVARFPPGWTSEAEFCMEARARGHRGALVAGITCGHRVQPGLIDAGAFLDRARRMGATTARIQQNEARIRGVRPRAIDRVVLGPLKHAAAITLWTLRDMRARRTAGPAGVITRARAQLRIGRHQTLLRGPGREASAAPPD